MKLCEYLAGFESATTSEELEAAIRAPFKHRYGGPTWSRISKARINKGRQLVDGHPHGGFVPHFKEGRGRQLLVCGESYKVGRGQNSTGVRYTWHYAGEWAIKVLRRRGFTKRASHRLWDSDWATYPHRSLGLVEAALAGKIPDPETGVLIRHDRCGFGRPIRLTVEQNDSDSLYYRANKPCECGGILFDWGGGFSEGFDFVNWHCNGCPDVFTEYLDAGGLAALRQVRAGMAIEEPRRVKD